VTLTEVVSTLVVAAIIALAFYMIELNRRMLRRGGRPLALADADAAKGRTGRERDGGGRGPPSPLELDQGDGGSLDGSEASVRPLSPKRAAASSAVAAAAAAAGAQGDATGLNLDGGDGGGGEEGSAHGTDSTGSLLATAVDAVHRSVQVRITRPWGSPEPRRSL
jgi:hypothetical protein